MITPLPLMGGRRTHVDRQSASPGHEHVGDERNPQPLARVPQPRGDLVVAPGWSGPAAWVVVDEDELRAVVADELAKHVPRVRVGDVRRPHSDQMNDEDPHVAVEAEHITVLLLGLPERAHLGDP